MYREDTLDGPVWSWRSKFFNNSPALKRSSAVSTAWLLLLLLPARFVIGSPLGPEHAPLVVVAVAPMVLSLLFFLRPERMRVRVSARAVTVERNGNATAFPYDALEYAELETRKKVVSSGANSAVHRHIDVQALILRRSDGEEEEVRAPLDALHAMLDAIRGFLVDAPTEVHVPEALRTLQARNANDDG